MESAAAPPPQSTAKLRLMCSYGGHILPRPGTNSFFYAGGDTRILSIDRSTLATLSSFHSHLSAVLSLKYPFTLKYQLPHLPLDSLISLASDEDLHILVDEHQRASATPSSSRFRLFVFPAFRHPKSESWFLDALKSSSIMQDSLPLDTTSSFGSTSSSSASFTPLLPPPLHDHDFPSSSHSLPSDTTVSSIMSHQQNICYQDPVVHVSEATLNAETVQVEGKIPVISSGVVPNNANVDVGYSSFPQFNQVERPNFQFVQSAATHFLPLHTPLNSLPSGHHIYQQPRPSQHLVYQTNHMCPVYLVPVTMPIPASTQASISHLSHNSTSNTQNYLTHTEPTAFVHLPYNEIGESEMDIDPMHHQQSQSQSQDISITSMESPDSGNELDNNLTRDQIYKSQPPPPAFPSKHQTVKKATTKLLSEALAQLHVDSLKLQQTETSQPQ